jgi:hypothetical protein
MHNLKPNLIPFFQKITIKILSHSEDFVLSILDNMV